MPKRQRGRGLWSWLKGKFGSKEQAWPSVRGRPSFDTPAALQNFQPAHIAFAGQQGYSDAGKPGPWEKESGHRGPLSGPLARRFGDTNWAARLATHIGLGRRRKHRKRSKKTGRFIR